MSLWARSTTQVPPKSVKTKAHRGFHPCSDMKHFQRFFFLVKAPKWQSQYTPLILCPQNGTTISTHERLNKHAFFFPRVLSLTGSISPIVGLSWLGTIANKEKDAALKCFKHIQAFFFYNSVSGTMGRLNWVTNPPSISTPVQGRGQSKLEQSSLWTGLKQELIARGSASNPDLPWFSLKILLLNISKVYRQLSTYHQLDKL